MRRLGGPSATDSINASLSKAVTAATALQGSAQTPSVPAYNGSTVTWSTQPFTDLQLQTVNVSQSVSTPVVNCTTSVSAPTAYVPQIQASSGDITITAPTNSVVRVAHGGETNGAVNDGPQRVMTVPVLESDGTTQIAANRTYEVVTPATWQSGDPVQFRSAPAAPPAPYYLSANKNGNQMLSTTFTRVSDWTVLAASDATDFNATTGVWTCPSTGVYTCNYELLVEGGVGLNVAALLVVGTTFARTQTFSLAGGHADDYKFFPLHISAMREITAGTNVEVRITASHTSDRLNGNYQTHMWIQRVGA